jgi:hypothetical protein
MMSRQLDGRCLCGSIRFRVGPERAMHACHCRQCRQFSGGVFMVVDCGTSMQVESGHEFLTFFSSSDWAERGFCNRCGASLFWRGKPSGKVYASIQAFEDPAQFVFSDEIYVDSKPSNYHFANETVRKTEAEFLASLT